MRHFTCFVYDEVRSVPSLSIIIAADLERARELARRELLSTREGVSVEICEDGKLISAEAA